MKTLLSILTICFLSACKTGGADSTMQSQAQADKARSPNYAEGPSIVPSTYRWCDGAAQKPGTGYIIVGIHRFTSKVKVALYDSKQSAESGAKPAFEAEDWDAKMDSKSLVDSLTASPNLADPNADMLALIISKLNPNAPKVSGLLIHGGKSESFPSLTCEK